MEPEHPSRIQPQKRPDADQQHRPTPPHNFPHGLKDPSPYDGLRELFYNLGERPDTIVTLAQILKVAEWSFPITITEDKETGKKTFTIRLVRSGDRSAILAFDSVQDLPQTFDDLGEHFLRMRLDDFLNRTLALPETLHVGFVVKGKLQAFLFSLESCRKLCLDCNAEVTQSITLGGEGCTWKSLELPRGISHMDDSQIFIQGLQNLLKQEKEVLYAFLAMNAERKLGLVLVCEESNRRISATSTAAISYCLHNHAPLEKSDAIILQMALTSLAWCEKMDFLKVYEKLDAC